MIIKRTVYQQLKAKVEPGKVLVLYGPRRVGKTFLLQKLVADKDLKKEKIVFLRGDRARVSNQFSKQNVTAMVSLIGKDTSLLILDEAQKIDQVGLNLKLLIDTNPELKVIASGSASFELANQLGEPLTGRKKTVKLFPVWSRELIETKSQLYFDESLSQRLIFGNYPEVFLQGSLSSTKEYLQDLVSDYLYRDILELQNVKNSKKIQDLLTLIAFQIGQEVSLSELGNKLDLHKNTVARYLDLLEKSFVVMNIRGFSRNLRKEVYKSSRWYFYDNGVRNALINNFNSLKKRDDVGQLWENYLVMERLKKQAYQPIFSNNYFWRTYDQQEIDLVEERDGQLHGFEFKWNQGAGRKVRAPKAWHDSYPEASFEVVTRENYLKFVS